MDELAIQEIAQMVFANAISQAATFYTILGAYLAAAYVVGKKLSTFQLYLINRLFVVFAILSSLGLYGSLSMATSYLMEVAKINPNRVPPTDEIFNWITMGIHALAVTGCLLFMVSVRKRQ